MIRLASSFKLAVALIAAAGAMDISVSSASAHTWAPLSTAFEGTNTTTTKFVFKAKEGAMELPCHKDTLAGTTAGTASSALKGTPTFASCEFFSLASTLSFSCKEGNSPWTLALTTGAKGTLAFGCAMHFVVPAISCTVTIPEQAAQEGFTWTNVGTKKGVKLEFAVKKLSGTATAGCSGTGKEEALEVEFTGTYEIGNVYVV